MIAENILFELGSKSGLYGIRKRLDGLGAFGVCDNDTVAYYATVTETGEFVLFVPKAYVVCKVVGILCKVRITRFTIFEGESHSVRSFKELV
jgi:hypothetical protein